ncbi:glutaminase [Parvularcula oceani]|uniref:glutaminase n=1 Tax=Parvularcula oceani TaxID=1247963 RepID=UPI0004E1EDB4|nr:glutaminase [Parvularcula oceani]
MRIDRFSHLDWQGILSGIAQDVEPHLGQGRVADYIPALAEQDPRAFAMAFTSLRGETYAVGQSDRPFSIQSISKVFTLVLALQLEGEGLWSRVGREPSGTPFNSIVQLEREKGRPRNPFINAGAIAVTDSVVGHCGSASPAQTILSFVRRCAGSDAPAIDERVAASERDYGDRNRALGYFMKSFGVVKNAVPDVLDTYFSQCAIAMSAAELSRAGLFLAGGGNDPRTGEAISDHERVDRVNATMMLCGHYDMSGDFAFRVGLAGKSGVGGGILAVIPEVGCVTVWSPGLNAAGNSLAGTLALEWFSERTGVNLF